MYNFMYKSLKSSNPAILNITRFQTATYVFLEAENIPKISGQVACFLQQVPTGLYICTFAAALLSDTPESLLGFGHVQNYYQIGKICSPAVKK